MVDLTSPIQVDSNLLVELNNQFLSVEKILFAFKEWWKGIKIKIQREIPIIGAKIHFNIIIKLTNNERKNQQLINKLNKSIVA